MFAGAAVSAEDERFIGLGNTDKNGDHSIQLCTSNSPLCPTDFLTTVWPVPNSPCGLCERKAALNLTLSATFGRALFTETFKTTY